MGRAGSSCVFKESLQLNHDEFDKNTKLYVDVKNQDVVGNSDIASREFSAVQLNRLLEPDTLVTSERTISRTLDLGWGSTMAGKGKVEWSEAKFKSFDLVPAGRIWLRIQWVA